MFYCQCCPLGQTNQLKLEALQHFNKSLDALEEKYSVLSLNIAQLACISESLFVLLVQLLHPLLILLQRTCKEEV